MVKKISLSRQLKFILLIILILSMASCTSEDGECETETVCFGDGNCVERPVPGSCF